MLTDGESLSATKNRLLTHHMGRGFLMNLISDLKLWLNLIGQAQAGNSICYLRDIRGGVTDGWMDGWTNPLIEMR